MTDSNPPPAAVERIWVGQVFAESYGLLFANLRHFPRAFAVPLLLMLPILWIQAQLLQQAAAEAPTPQNFGVQAMSLVLQLLSLIPYALFAVSWLRLVLKVPGAEPPPVFPRIGARHLRYLGLLLAIFAGSVVGTIGFALLVSILALFTGSPGATDIGAGEQPGPAALLLFTGLCYGLTAAYIVLRLSFVFPATAADEAYGWGQSWEHTRGQGARFLLAVIAAILPAAFAGSIFLLFLFAILGDDGGMTLILMIIVLAIGYLINALTLSVIAVCFQTCTGWVPGPVSGTPAVPDANDQRFE